VGNEVLRDERLVNEFDDTLHGSVGGFLDGVADLIPGGLLLETDSQVNNGYIGGWNSESHTSQLSFKFWNN